MVEWFNISVRCIIWSLFFVATLASYEFAENCTEIQLRLLTNYIVSHGNSFPLLTSQQVTISQNNVVVRLNEIINLTCKTNVKTPIKSCLWEINSKLYNLEFGSHYDLLGDLENGECGIRGKITEEENGVWICRVFLKYDQKNNASGREIKDSANVTVIALPNISIISDERILGNFINVIADEKEKEINCSTFNARPVPTIRWKLGDELIPSHRQETYVIDRNVDGKVNVTSTLKYVFQSSDHGKLLRCVLTNLWILKDDPHETNITLNVTFVPQPTEEGITLYGFVLGQPGNITLDFTASTRPSRVLWNIDNETELVVESSKNLSTLIHNPDNFEVSKLNNLNGTLYEVSLRIVSVREEDFNRLYRLVVEWENTNVTQEYLVRISTDQLPKNNQTNSAFAVTGTRRSSTVAFALILAAVIFYALKYRRL